MCRRCLLSSLVLFVALVLASCGGSQTPEPLSASCDHLLCAGYDAQGNKYELVANQAESSRGFEIKVGVIKNNSWLYPLSSDFPFLGEDGLFHVQVNISLIGDDAATGTSLAYPNRVIDKLYFIDSGAFLMECYREGKGIFDPAETYYLVFSCDTQKCKKIDRTEANLLFRYREPKFADGKVYTFGEIFADNGKLIMYTETSGTSSGWLENKVFKWNVFNAETLTTDTIASNVKGVIPESPLSEGLFFCSDKCFYDLNGKKTIDLSDYSLSIGEEAHMFFQDGTCSFKAKNKLGTTFIVTIDPSGNVLSEVVA